LRFGFALPLYAFHRPLEYPYCSSGFWGARSVGLEESVCEDEEFSHDCGQGDFCGLSELDEVLVFGLHVRIESGSDEGWHVEGLADVGTAALNE
jgi:hypothetical protein